MSVHRIHRGFDIPLAGKAPATWRDAPEPLVVAVEPLEIAGIKPKVLVDEGESVRTGQPIVLDKRDRAIQLASPATGKVTKIEFGERRVPLRIEITPSGPDRYFDGAKLDPARIASLPREELQAALKQAGLWPLIRQRPLGKMTFGIRQPVAIFVNGMDTEPLAADPAFASADQAAELQLACDLLRRLGSGPVHVTMRGGAVPETFRGLRGVELHQFDGPHPAGLVGTHISRLRPLRGAETAWYLKAQEAAVIGRWLRTGRYPWERVVAVAGSEAPQPGYYRTRQGAALITFTGGRAPGPDTRAINGTVLSGRAIEPDPRGGFLGFYAQTVTLIPEGGDTRDLFGWMRPQIGKLSMSRSVLSWLARKPQYVLDARLHGGRRAIVDIGQWRAVLPHDIHPTYLVRAIQAGDLEEAIGLGLLELTEEDVALCTFADPSKIEVGEVIRRGLDLYEQEGG
jgi:Na+-transporting NADH:ubiquinone oxidoreductase subunit A